MPVLQGGIDWDGFVNNFATAFGLVNQQQQQKIENKRNQQTDTENAALTQAQLADYNQNRVKTRTEIEASGYDPDTGGAIASAIHYNPPPKNPTGDALAQWAQGNYAIAQSANNGQGDPAGIARWGDAVNRLPRAYQEITGGQKNVAQTANIRGLFAQEWKMAQAKFGNNLQMVTMREQGAAARAAKAAGRGKSLSSMNSDEKNTIYMLMALDRLQGSSDEHAFADAMRQYDARMSAWKAGESAATQGLTGDDRTNAAQQYGQQNPMPSINNITIPSTDGGMGAIVVPLIMDYLKKQGVNLPQNTTTNNTKTNAAPHSYKPGDLKGPDKNGHYWSYTGIGNRWVDVGPGHQ